MAATKITLYEIFGYLLPGSVLLVAIHLILAILNSGQSYVSDSVQVSVVNLVFAYFLGHFCQAIGNTFSTACENHLISEHSSKITQIRKVHNIDSLVSDEQSFKIAMNIASTSKYKTSNIDTYIEREGFYRGAAVGFLLFFAVTLVSVFAKDIIFTSKDYIIFIGKYQKGFMCILACGMGTTFFIRYLRFLNYKINAVLDATRDLIQ